MENLFTTENINSTKTIEPSPIMRHYCHEIQSLTTIIYNGKYTSPEELIKLCEKIKKFANGIEEFQSIHFN